ncbi:hypothetical protein PENTCL1PPCAC_13836, partial [Pristionchus entomophagus]
KKKKKEKKKDGEEEEVPTRSIRALKEAEKMRLRPLPMHIESLIEYYLNTDKERARQEEETIGKQLATTLTAKIPATETEKATKPLPYCRVCDAVCDNADAFYTHIQSDAHKEMKMKDSVPLFAEVETLTMNQLIAREFLGPALLARKEEEVEVVDEKCLDEFTDELEESVDAFLTQGETAKEANRRVREWTETFMNLTEEEMRTEEAAMLALKAKINSSPAATPPTSAERALVKILVRMSNKVLRSGRSSARKIIKGSIKCTITPQGPNEDLAQNHPNGDDIGKKEEGTEEKSEEGKKTEKLKENDSVPLFTEVETLMRNQVIASQVKDSPSSFPPLLAPFALPGDTEEEVKRRLMVLDEATEGLSKEDTKKYGIMRTFKDKLIEKIKDTEELAKTLKEVDEVYRKNKESPSSFLAPFALPGDTEEEVRRRVAVIDDSTESLGEEDQKEGRAISALREKLSEMIKDTEELAKTLKVVDEVYRNSEQIAARLIDQGIM